MSRFQFVDDHRNTYEVKRLCQVLDVNRSSYYKWLAGAEARATRQWEDQVLAEEIREVHGASGGAYGSPRVTAELREKGRRVNEKRVARIMRTFSITGIRLRRRVRTTVPDPATSPVPDLFQRDFTATEPAKYMGDITYLPLREFLYLATVLDCFSRKVVGWSIADHMRTDLVADALRMAAATRGAWTVPCSTPTTGPRRLPGLRRLCDHSESHVDGRGRHQRRQRGLRKLPRLPETRDPPGHPRLR
nr:IS3 family transposase [Streptomyces agglomeratus]